MKKKKEKPKVDHFEMAQKLSANFDFRAARAKMS